MNDIRSEVEELISTGRELSGSCKPYYHEGVVEGAPSLVKNDADFVAWCTKCRNLLKRILGDDSEYVTSFQSQVRTGKKDDVDRGVAILEAFHDDYANSRLAMEVPQSAIIRLNQILDRFHLIVRQLRSRYNSRPTLDISDEYDVQDLLHALLKLEFDDVRSEEWTPSYAGGSSRIDFLLKKEEILIEVKKTRTGLKEKQVREQLAIDIQQYRAHPDFKRLICFVYDPEGLVANPRGVEADLASDQDGFSVKVFIRPE